MRPPKKTVGVQAGDDPHQSQLELLSIQRRGLQELAEYMSRSQNSIQTLPGTSSQVGVLHGTRNDPGLGKKLSGFQFRQPAETKKTADAVNSRHVPWIEDMRPPKKTARVQAGDDPRHAPLELLSIRMRELQDLMAESRRSLNFVNSIQTLPGTSSQVGVLHGTRNDPGLAKNLAGFQFRQPVETKKTADAVNSRHVPWIEGDADCNKHCHQRSSSAPTKKMNYCNICRQSKPLSKFFFIKGCVHSYCSKCLHTYIKTKVNMKATQIKCPEPSCKNRELEPLAFKSIITKEVFDSWCDVLSESSVRVKFYCPFKDCSALLIDERDQEVIRESECPHCHRLFCAHCEVPWHSGLSCSEFLETKNHDDKTLINLAEKSNWQRCPKCKFYVEKISGCMFILCRCGANFCYICASEMEDVHDHYCRKCKR